MKKITGIFLSAVGVDIVIGGMILMTGLIAGDVDIFIIGGMVTGIGVVISLVGQSLLTDYSSMNRFIVEY